jgi:predicted esterase
MDERFIRVPRTARYHVLGVVENAPEVWIVVHGYGQLARYFLRPFEGLEDVRCIVAPEGLSRFYLDAEHTRVGATWMTREDRMNEIEDHINYLDQLASELLSKALPNATLNVLGFSQGVATVSRWLARTRHRAKRAVLWAGSLPPDIERAALESLQAGQFDLVLGDRDTIVTDTVLGNAVQRLNVAGTSHRVHRFVGAHTLDAMLLRRLMALS